jgi:hypothetical protein
MAMVFAPFGFRVAQDLNATGSQYQEEFILDKDYGTALFDGDPVKSAGAGDIALATRGDQILGIFRGWRQPTFRIGGHVMAGNTSAMIPWNRKWTPGTYTNGADVVAAVDVNPNQIWEVQCIGSVTAADIGQFVNLEPQTGDSLNMRSRYCIGPAVDGGPITSVTVGGSGSGYVNGNAITVTRHASDPYFNAETAAGTIAVTTGNVTGVTVTAGGFYSASHLPTVTAPTGTGNTFTAVVTAVTRDQFQIISVVQKQYREADANNNTTGFGLTGYGTYATVRVRCVNHERGPGVVAAAV